MVFVFLVFLGRRLLENYLEYIGYGGLFLIRVLIFFGEFGEALRFER